MSGLFRTCYRSVHRYWKSHSSLSPLRTFRIYQAWSIMSKPEHRMNAQTAYAWVARFTKVIDMSEVKTTRPRGCNSRLSHPILQDSQHRPWQSYNQNSHVLGLPKQQRERAGPAAQIACCSNVKVKVKRDLRSCEWKREKK